MSAVFGMAVPAALPTDSINTAGLHTYILLLDVALVAVVLGTKRWRIIMSIAAAGTWIWWGVWCSAVSTEQLVTDRGLALMLLGAGGVLFSIADLLCLRAGIRFDKVLERGLSSASAVTWLGFLVAVVEPTPQIHQLTFLIAGAWFAIAAWLSSRLVVNERAAMSQYTSLALVSCVAAAFIIVEWDAPYAYIVAQSVSCAP
ncbi:MAG: hypothetical protein SGJ05_05880 [bacterium]|nr:hypothetical protein [bacterium]